MADGIFTSMTRNRPTVLKEEDDAFACDFGFDRADTEYALRQTLKLEARNVTYLT